MVSLRLREEDKLQLTGLQKIETKKTEVTKVQPAVRGQNTAQNQAGAG